MPGSTEHRINIVLVVFDTLRKDCVGCYGSSPPWDGASPVQTPNLDRFAEECIRFTSAYPESLPTLPARRSIYTGMRTYPFHDGRFRLRGDFVPAPGWGPIPEDQDTLAEMLGNAGYRTALISDLYHQFKPSKNYWRGFDQWSFIRGQETDPAVSGPLPTKDDIDRWVPKPIQELRFTSDESYRAEGDRPSSERFFERAWLNRPRGGEERWPNAQVMVEAARWLEENADARERGQPFFLTVECFDPHEPWFVPDHYLRLYDHGPEQAISPYAEIPHLPEDLVRRTRATYAALTTMVDRWFGHFLEALRVGGWLDDTLVIVASDHGHSLHERSYTGKRGYPSEPEVIDTILLLRRPRAEAAGTTCDAWVQHHDIAGTILDAAGLGAPIHGRSLLDVASGASSTPAHVVVGWGPAVTVIDDSWWLNCKVDGRGPLLYGRGAGEGGRGDANLAEDHPEVVRKMYELAVAEADGRFPGYLLEEAHSTEDAPGCSPFAAIPLAGS